MWRDNATNETGFAVERCTGVDCGLAGTNFTQIAVAPPRNNTGNTTYVDTTVAYGNIYSYRVMAINAGTGLTSAYSPIPPAVVSAVVPAIPAAPTGFIAANTPANGPNSTMNLTWVHDGLNVTNFTIQRATNLSFTTNLATFTPAATPTSLTQTVRDNTTYYYRIRANNSVGGSSAWTNASPFPIGTRN